jgi:hypothetical protein
MTKTQNNDLVIVLDHKRLDRARFEMTHDSCVVTQQEEGCRIHILEHLIKYHRTTIHNVDIIVPAPKKPF